MPTVPLSLFHPVRALPPPPFAPNPFSPTSAPPKAASGGEQEPWQPPRTAVPSQRDATQARGGHSGPRVATGWGLSGATPTQGDKPGKGDSRIWEERGPGSLTASLPGYRGADGCYGDTGTTGDVAR